MNVTSRKRAPAITKSAAVAAIGVCVVIMVCGCSLYQHMGEAIAEQMRENARGKTFTWIFADETGKDRAEMPLPEPNAEPNSRSVPEVRCLDDNSVWKPDFKKSIDFSTRGYVSTAPVKAITSWPSSQPATLPAARTWSLVLVDERGRVRGVFRQQKDTDLWWEIHPVGSTSIWKVDWGKSFSRFFGDTETGK